MPGTTPTLALRYPLATEAPDGPGAMLALATDVDNSLGMHHESPEPYIQLVSPCSFDSTPGANIVVRMGQLRIVHFSIFSGTGIVTSGPFAFMNQGHRPYGPIHTGGVAWESVERVAAFRLLSSGAMFLQAFYPDSGNDGTVGSVRGTFVYFATQ